MLSPKHSLGQALPKKRRVYLSEWTKSFLSTCSWYKILKKKIEREYFTVTHMSDIPSPPNTYDVLRNKTL